MVWSLAADDLRAWVQLCTDALARHRVEIDSVNVFPVADNDTGANSFLTFAAGVEALTALPRDADTAAVSVALGDGLLTGAKGNSGVILSQLVRAFLRALALSGQPVPLISSADVAYAFELASAAARDAVAKPVDGTILSVAAAAAEGARMSADADRGVPHVFGAAAVAAQAALARTPDQLDRLAQAGVVDAGGLALVVVLDATDQALTGTVPTPQTTRVPAVVLPTADLVAGGPSYEVMYLLQADDAQIPVLRTALSDLGDSVVVVGGDGLWNVHVHVDDVGAAIEAGLLAGRPYRIAVTHFAEQGVATKRPTGTRRVVLAATTGDGLTDLCRAAGAECLPFSRDAQLTQAAMTRALGQRDVGEIIVLPNNSRYVSQFEASAAAVRANGVRVAVIPTHAQVQGLAALAVYDEQLPFDDVVVAMSNAAGATRHGAVTVATQPGMTMVGPCAVGDVLGVASGDFAVIGSDVAVVSAEIVDMLMSQSAEMVTVVLGEGGDDHIEQHVERYLRHARPDVDLVVYNGGQENYPAFIAVE